MPVIPTAANVALRLKGGVAVPASAAKFIGTGVEGTFNAIFVALISSVALLKVLFRDASTAGIGEAKIEPAVASLQRRFLAVFWLFRLADWLQGPYFYSVYASKVMPGGLTISEDTIAKLFLTGFGTTAILGPFIGNWIDRCGRKMGSIAFALFYIWGALAVRSNLLAVLFIGRVMGGVGTSLLMSAPESWLVGDATRNGLGKSLGAIFGLAYFGDSIVAMSAGQLAQATAKRGGPTMPFTISTVFLGLGAILAGFLWKENVGGDATSEPSEPSPSSSSGKGGAIGRAYSAMASDPKIALVGAVQSFFEGAMYIFVLQWPPALIAAIKGEVPFGKVFSCFMACCMFGSSLFKVLSDRKVAVEDTAVGMLAVAVGGMATAAVAGSSSQLAVLAAAFFAFELCVGLYFPTIGTLRAKYLPDEHRSILVNLFGIPLNLIVVTVFTRIKHLGTKGALWCSASSLTLALLAGVLLRYSNACSDEGE
jgi:MFS family permease